MVTAPHGGHVPRYWTWTYAWFPVGSGRQGPGYTRSLSSSSENHHRRPCRFLVTWRSSARVSEGSAAAPGNQHPRTPALRGLPSALTRASSRPLGAAGPDATRFLGRLSVLTSHSLLGCVGSPQRLLVARTRSPRKLLRALDWSPRCRFSWPCTGLRAGPHQGRSCVPRLSQQGRQSHLGKGTGSGGVKDVVTDSVHHSAEAVSSDGVCQVGGPAPFHFLPPRNAWHLTVSP